MRTRNWKILPEGLAISSKVFHIKTVEISDGLRRYARINRSGHEASGGLLRFTLYCLVICYSQIKFKVDECRTPALFRSIILFKRTITGVIISRLE